MATPRLDDYVAAFELGVFMKPMSGVCQLVTRAQTDQRCIFGMQMDGGVKQRHLLQGFANHPEQHFRFHGNGLPDDLTCQLNTQGQQVVGNCLVEFCNVPLKVFQGQRQSRGFLAASWMACWFLRRRLSALLSIAAMRFCSG